MSEPEAQPVDEDGEVIPAPEDEDVPEAMTGSAAPDLLGSGHEYKDPEPDDEPAPAQEGYPITIALDDQGNGSVHVGMFAKDIASVEIDDVDPECIFAGEAAVGITAIEVRGASTRSKPVSGIVITR